MVASFEIPLTRVDFGFLLTGDPLEKVINLLHAAIEARLENIEMVTEHKANRGDISGILTNKDSRSFFMVPDYFYNAWVEALRGDVVEQVQVRIYGMHIIGWGREFIRLELDMGEVAEALRKALSYDP
jgi:hypothetical protein